MCSSVGWIYTYNCCSFFLDWPLDHYVGSFTVCCKGLYFKVYFIVYEYCYSHFLLISICVSLGLRWVSCRQHVQVSCFCINSASPCLFVGTFMAQTVNRLSATQETQVRSLGWENLLEKEMAAHSNILAWKIPWIAEPGRLPSMGSQRVRHDWATSLHNVTLSYYILFYLIVYPSVICQRNRVLLST